MKSNVDRLHEADLTIVKEVIKICDDHNLKYYMLGGTQLGAIRHKGFIPWDDDIDIAMPRKDYEKLLQLNLVHPQYKILSMDNNNEYVWAFAKLIDKGTYVKEKNINNISEYGIYIDIFPIDGLGNNKIVAILYEYIIRFLRGRFGIVINGYDKAKFFIKRIIQKRYNKMGKEKVYNKILKYATKHDFYKSKYVGSVVGGARGKKEIFKYEVYSETMDMPFENLTLKGMKYYDEYLSRMYGNYMELPPEDKRGGFHTIECYYREEGE